MGFQFPEVLLLNTNKKYVLSYLSIEKKLIVNINVSKMTVIENTKNTKLVKFIYYCFVLPNVHYSVTS